MKTSTSQYLYSIGRQAWHELKYLSKKVINFILQTPLPKVLAVCILIAIALVLLPMVLSLFILFLLVKCFIVLVALSVQRQRGRPSQLPFQPYSRNHQRYHSDQ